MQLSIQGLDEIRCDENDSSASGRDRRSAEKCPVKEIAYGSWPSPLGSDRIAAGGLRLSQPQICDGWVYWLEGRPGEGGRQVVMRRALRDDEAAAEECTAPGVDVRSVVHEYGGGDYLAAPGRLFYAENPKQRICELGRDAAWSPADAPEHSSWADFDLSPDGRWLVAIEERPRAQAEPENRIVALRVDEAGPAAQVVVAGRDFVSFPRFSPDGRSLAFTAWDHPDMPWDSNELWELPWSPSGPAGEARRIAGGQGESVFQPRYSPGGRLTFVSDRSGWWNLYQERDGEVQPLAPRECEFGRPQWVFGMSTYDFIDEEQLLCAFAQEGIDHLARLDLASSRLEPLDLPFSSIEGVQVGDGVACFVGASPTRCAGIDTLDLASGVLRRHRAASASELDVAWISQPEVISFPSQGGRRVHGFYYPPRNPEVRGPAGQRPPLLVKSHGGPTAATDTGLDLRIQYWTTRGIGVVDVNYTGSTGYGRAYREALKGQWGVVDVEDCVEAARHLVAEGRADGERLAISGGSAGGYTTLCALTFHDLFGAGASHYGIGDLEALARDTHKFEARYLDRLVGPYPEERERYRARSPIHFTDQLECPVIFFQGADDKVVPPSQAEAMVEALRARGIPHAHVVFPGERHGFRKAESIRTALDGELYFYARVFGFEVGVEPAGVEIVG